MDVIERRRTMRLQQVGIVALLLGASLCAYRLGQSKEPVKGNTSPKESADTAPVSRTEDRPQVIHNVVIQAQAAPTAAPSAPREDAPEGEKGEPVTVESMHQNIEAAYRTQRRDANWAPGAAQDLEKQFKMGQAADLAVQNIECADTLCRTDVVFDSENAFDNFMNTALRPSKRIWRGAFFNARMGETSEGKPIIRMFWAREGTELPLMPSE
jgi:type IV secretory pathway VirB10-like protein